MYIRDSPDAGTKLNTQTLTTCPQSLALPTRCCVWEVASKSLPTGPPTRLRSECAHGRGSKPWRRECAGGSHLALVLGLVKANDALFQSEQGVVLPLPNARPRVELRARDTSCHSASSRHYKQVQSGRRRLSKQWLIQADAKHGAHPAGPHYMHRNCGWQDGCKFGRIYGSAVPSHAAVASD